jgi:hypothetical protein
VPQSSLTLAVFEDFDRTVPKSQFVFVAAGWNARGRAAAADAFDVRRHNKLLHCHRDIVHRDDARLRGRDLADRRLRCQ